MLGRLLRRSHGDKATAAAVPEGVRVYAVGDIHGRADLLHEINDLIAADAARAPQRTAVVVYLGDYVDRGLDSRGVIDLHLDSPPAGIAPVFLKGNHEDMMLRFLDDIAIGPAWLEYGGMATLGSYGISFSGPRSDEATLRTAQRALNDALPARHLTFLRALARSHEIGDYLFVHAGIRPGVAIEAQAETDLLWIRNPFLTSNADHGRVVVHGHSIQRAPEFRANRIGIDTGAYASGVLTCLVLEGTELRLLQTAR